MQFDWTTFTLELINFLVLIWILKRFLYRPVMAVIERRRQRVEQTLNDAQTLQQQAERLRADYENRLGAWQGEQVTARDALRRELQTEREQRLAQLADEMDQEREKARVLLAREQEDHQRHLEQRALEQGARFTSQLLGRLACPEVQAQLLNMLLQDLKELPDDTRSALRTALQANATGVEVISAYPLDTDQQQAIRAALATLTGGLQQQCSFHADTALLAGVRLTAGPWVLNASLQDELQFFTGAGHAGH